MAPELVYSFGHFRLFPERRALLGGDQTLKLGGRAFDVLLALLEHRDRVLSRDALMRIVWPRVVVEEGNLNVQILMLRKLLGYPAIATVPGRGYRFALPVTREGGSTVAEPVDVEPAPPSPTAAADETPTNLPVVLSPLYGRDEDLVAVKGLLATQRIVTIAGAAGIGKTRLGQAVASQLRADYADGVWWVELASLSQGALVVPAIATILGLDSTSTRNPTAAVVAYLRAQRLLLVLDNCEHVLDAVAPFAEALWSGAPGVSVLVTSQEPLKTTAEQVYRLNTLSLPDATEAHLPASVAASGAGALFLARARAVESRFDITSANVAAVYEICRRLDGIPLAIELAAARLPVMGIEGLRAKLSQRFNVLTGGARAVLRRHQTLLAALDWSHSLLTPEEQAVFRRLGVFAGGFTLESAQRVARDDAIDEWDVLEYLGALVDKSLVIAEGDPLPRYKLLETTRLFALERLGEAGETDATLRAHVEAMVALIRSWSEGPKRQGSLLPNGNALIVEADNVRAALDWLDHSPRDSGAMDELAVELGGLAGHVLIEASGRSEAFDRTLALRSAVNVSTPPELAAQFWLMLAFTGSIAGRAESYEAATRAVDLYRQLGDDRARYVCLTSQIAIGARRGDAALESLIDEARGIERATWPANLLGSFRWACYRWLMSQGRADEALLRARERADLARDAGMPTLEQFVLGDIVADCEIALGRNDDAVALCRQALACLEDANADPHDTVHVVDTYAVALTMQGRAQEAIAMGRRALKWSRSDDFHFRMLEPMAINAAHQGRVRDAAWAIGHVDAEYARRGEVRWPHVAARRARLDDVLAAALGRDELNTLKAAGAAGDLAVAFERAFGDGGELPAVVRTINNS